MGPVGVPVPGRGGAAYQVHIGRGLLASLGELVGAAAPAARHALIVDQHVAERYGRAAMESLAAAGLDVVPLPFPAGEWNKSRERWAELTDRMLAAGIGRDGAVIGFGGGVSGDLAGFVAATYLRGIPVVQVPTTLLAMIDSSVGGKTGVDVPAGKNLVGAFHPPALVVADVDLLATLPRIHMAAGMSEAIKHGLVLDADYLATLADPAPILARDPATLAALVRRSVELKASVVARDEREHGLRAVLNFGHTVGHALESLSGYDLLHGEAVAIGMTVEARIGEALGVTDSSVSEALEPLLSRYALPRDVPDTLSKEALLEAMRVDKKSRGGRVRFALPERAGTMCRSDDGAWTVTADDTVITRALRG